MAFKLFAFIAGVAVIYFELRPFEAFVPLAHTPLAGLAPIPPSNRRRNRQVNPPVQTDPYRMNLPQPFQDDPETVEESLELYKMGLKKDPCRNYCAQDVIQSEILKDCGEMVQAIVFLARNNHPKVKPECATARLHECKWRLTSFGHACTFKVTKTSWSGEQKEKTYTLKDCKK